MVCDGSIDSFVADGSQTLGTITGLSPTPTSGLLQVVGQISLKPTDANAGRPQKGFTLPRLQVGPASASVEIDAGAMPAAVESLEVLGSTHQIVRTKGQVRLTVQRSAGFEIVVDGSLHLLVESDTRPVAVSASGKGRLTLEGELTFYNSATEQLLLDLPHGSAVHHASGVLGIAHVGGSIASGSFSTAEVSRDPAVASIKRLAGDGDEPCQDTARVSGFNLTALRAQEIGMLSKAELLQPDAASI